MSDLTPFPVAARWPAQHPDRIQLYSFPTPNGVKVSIALEELDLPYEAHAVNIGKNESWTPEFLSLNPNGKIPAIIDPNGPGGKPIALFESGAILLYLADKTGQLIPADRARRYETDAVGVLPDGLGRADVRPARLLPQIRRPRDRRQAPARALPRRIAPPARRARRAAAGRKWIMDDDYTIADISLLGWVRNLIGFYEARELVGFDAFGNVAAWLERGLARPAVQKGLNIPPRP